MHLCFNMPYRGEQETLTESKIEKNLDFQSVGKIREYGMGKDPLLNIMKEPGTLGTYSGIIKRQRG